MDLSLVDHAPDLVAIFAHEVYHFVWRRLGHPLRAEWMELLNTEKRPKHAGLSSELRYAEFLARKTKAAWKNYGCEAFCDTAAVLSHTEKPISLRRKQWFLRLIKERKLPL
ncbi:hypothetical protein [Bryobacter aggregatus]|uniref:hypothetical protein n=1 Tax=Bryobacter aggregatus TaxID=360054 RepID=UPI0012BAC36C|nr:hypothetical protein [Bryobacter aggregatus]